MADTDTPVKTIEVQVLRYRPEQEQEPVWQSYQVPFTDDMSVLQGLQHIKDDMDGTLSFRWSCRMAICGRKLIRAIAAPTARIVHSVNTHRGIPRDAGAGACGESKVIGTM